MIFWNIWVIRIICAEMDLEILYFSKKKWRTMDIVVTISMKKEMLWNSTTTGMSLNPLQELVLLFSSFFDQKRNNWRINIDHWKVIEKKPDPGACGCCITCCTGAHKTPCASIFAFVMVIIGICAWTVCGVMGIDQVLIQLFNLLQSSSDDETVPGIRPRWRKSSDRSRTRMDSFCNWPMETSWSR